MTRMAIRAPRGIWAVHYVLVPVCSAEAETDGVVPPDSCSSLGPPAAECVWNPGFFSELWETCGKWDKLKADKSIYIGNGR